MKKLRLRLATFFLTIITLFLVSALLATAQDYCDTQYDCEECTHSSCCSATCSSCCSATCCCNPRMRSQLTGDWLGCRTTLAECGIVFDADVTQFYQGVASGGLEQRFRYGGHGDYVLKFDFDKLTGQEGLFLQLRGEHRFGQSLGLNDTGAFSPAAILANLPAPTEDLILTNVVITQALSEQFVVFFGKMDTLDGDMNAFAHGRGKNQFLNTNFVFNPIAVQTIPYSTLGVGFSILRDFEPLFTFSVLNATDTTTTSGFDELFDDGVALSAELRCPTGFFGLPGHQGMGATWNSKEYVALGQDPHFSGVPNRTEKRVLES
jgi:porin